jgi:hypothetical protein
MTVEQLKDALEKLVKEDLGDTLVHFAEGIYDSPSQALTDVSGLHSVNSVTKIVDVASVDWEVQSAVWLS